VLKHGGCLCYRQKLFKCMYYNYFCRGDSFRVAFAKLGTLRSILPSQVSVLALTATATRETYKCVEDHLELRNVVLVGKPSDRINIKYIVKPFIKVDELSLMLTNEILKLQTNMPKTVVFCPTLLQCANLLATLKQHLGDNITKPPGMPITDIKYRVVDVFTSGSTPEMREIILQEYCKQETNLRVIIATNAFGLGVDCSDITRIIHWGPPSTLEELAQETGRAGRNGSLSEAILFYKKAGKHISKSMKRYGESSSVCRRKMMFQDFLFSNAQHDAPTLKACRCCDICAPLCNCSSCTIAL